MVSANENERTASARHSRPPNELERIENFIRSKTRLRAHVSIQFCEYLADLVYKRRYREGGFTDLRSYLSSGALPMKHKTVLWDAKLGQIWRKYRRELTSAGFHDGSGINKLRYLKRALVVHDDERCKVFTNICSMSYRDFSIYATSSVDGRQEDSPTGPVRERCLPTGTVVCSDDTLFLRTSSGKSNEIVWINPEFFGSEGAYAEFRSSIARFVRDYLRPPGGE